MMAADTSSIRKTFMGFLASVEAAADSSAFFFFCVMRKGGKKYKLPCAGRAEMVSSPQRTDREGDCQPDDGDIEQGAR
jgi:hypothetical protein